ncbi:MAG: right-handed parallel beta-helix repeat-containing protein [Thermoguttaceae bacterium]|nr:right-handed parallel beta-helix repeat-containing protein [Thermoguttaceae bacterium]MDW8079650.1 right-handed parallel beta-helix repeat-containing protein [Thermoguttaceae bacterium]
MTKPRSSRTIREECTGRGKSCGHVSQIGRRGFLRLAAVGISLPHLALGLGRRLSPAELPDFSWLPSAPPLPPPEGQIIYVKTVDELFAAAEKVRPGGTILLADGVYKMPRYFEIHTDRVTLRSASGQRDQVILDGSESRHGELVGISYCSGVTIAHLTIQNVRFNGFKLNSNLKAHEVTIYDCVIHNVWQRGVKGPAVPEKDAEALSPRRCRVQYCLFYNDRPKRWEDDPTDRPETFGGNYVGGIDVMQARGWVISDNVFWGIRGRTGEARGAIFLWMDSRDCVVERNVIVNCDSGICLGNSHRARFPIHCVNCTVRNNFIVGAPENGILADYTQDCRILHNTVHCPDSRLKRLIRLVHDNEGLVVANNLLSGPEMRVETESAVLFRGNLTRVVPEFFRDIGRGDLHLLRALPDPEAAVDNLPEVPEDFDRQPRGHRTHVGADDPIGGTAASVRTAPGEQLENCRRLKTWPGCGFQLYG